MSPSNVARKGPGAVKGEGAAPLATYIASIRTECTSGGAGACAASLPTSLIVSISPDSSCAGTSANGGDAGSSAITPLDAARSGAVAAARNAELWKPAITIRNPKPAA